MRSFFSRTFGGLTTSYYVRQFLFGLPFAFLVFLLAANSHSGLWGKPGLLVMAVVCTLLYPYSRFVYESIVDYVVGNNVFAWNVDTFLLAKFFTMFFCWWFSIFVAPVGLAYLYLRNSRQISQ